MLKKSLGILAVSGIALGLGALPAQAAVSTDNNAVIDNGSAYVRSSWVQAGLKENGSFGTENAVPTGFDSLFDSQSGGLGLIDDAGEDGFDIDDNGDFFMPGDPYEGWGVQVDDNASGRNDNEQTDIAGSWVSAETSGDASATWESTDPWDGIGIEQVVEAPANGDHLFRVTVTLTNTDSEPHVVFYTRQVDPDNNKDSGGDFDTFNRVIANSASSQIVTGTAYAPFTSIGYRAEDSSAAVRISDWSWPLEIGEEAATEAELTAAVAEMRSTYAVGYQDYLDSTIDIVFRKEIAAGGTATVEFDYILDPGLVGVPDLALDLSLDLAIGGSYSEASTALAGGGLAPESDYTLTEFSTPRVIFEGTTLPNGNFYDETALPVDCRPGSHHLVLSGTSPSGETVSDYVTYTVDEDCVVTAFNPYAGSAGDWAQLADTGFEVSAWLSVSGILAALGAVAVLAARRRKA